MPFSLSFGAQIDIVPCTANGDCNDNDVCTIDTCNLQTNICVFTPGNAGTVCRSAAGVCDADDVCNGTTAGCGPDLKKTVVCRSAAGVCDVPESCDGMTNDCPADGFAPSSQVCRSSAGVCDPAETCPGNGPDCPADAKSTAVCRTAAGVCDVPESCDGVNNDCPADAFATGVVCRSAAGMCDVAETCTGTGASCPADMKSTAVCRSANGVCDVPESCNGMSNDCPADGFAPSTQVCRSSAGVCDPAENCTGSGPNCPADGKSTAVCRSSAGVCDVAESCDGVNNNCPADGFAASGTVCRSAAGVCDVAEVCTGSSASCPADMKKTTTCRPGVDVCDVPEVCDGVSNDCPADKFAASTVTCRAANGVCDLAENCSGSSASCPADVKKPSGTVCRSSAGECDPAEVCDGTTDNCPADAKSPNGTSCTDDGNVCTLDVCNGSSALCTHPPGNAGTICRAANPSNQCDVAEQCTGSSINCPADGFKAPGTSCNADNDVCTLDQCNASGVCAVVGPSNDPSCGFCGQFAVGTCSVTIVGSPTVYTSLQAAVNVAANGSTIHVSGVCKGPTLISSRSNLIIEGDAPAACPPGPRDLTSTLVGDPNAVLLSGSNGEVVKAVSSKNITVRYLNIIKGGVNGGDDVGIEFKKSTACTAHCNCVALNKEGYDLDAPGSHVASASLVTHNNHGGIVLERAQTGTLVTGNISEFNGEDGIQLVEAGNHNTLQNNECRNNTLSGILLDNGDTNQILSNFVHDNALSGIQLQNGSDGNTVSGNSIINNGDGLTNLVKCLGDLTGNMGTNVPMIPACQ